MRCLQAPKAGPRGSSSVVAGNTNQRLGEGLRSWFGGFQREVKMRVLGASTGDMAASRGKVSQNFHSLYY